MASKDRIMLPFSQAGITRYFDEFKSKVELTPKAVLVLITIIVLLELLLHLLKPF